MNYVTAVGKEVASARYRIYSPAEQLAGDMRTAVSNTPLPGFSTYFFQKHWQPAYLEQARELRAAGKRVVFDVTDNHLANENAEWYRNMCAAADVVTCPTPTLATAIQRATGVTAHVVPDPYLFPLKPVSMVVGQPRLFWFGYSVGWPAVLRANEKSGGRLFANYSWTIVSNLTPQRTQLGRGVFVPWAEGVVEEEIAKANIVVLPVMEDAWGRGKSPNRVFESLISGKFVITTPGVDSYEAFKDYVYMTAPAGIEKGIAWACNRPGEAAVRTRAGQEYVLQAHDPRRIAAKWKEVFLCSQ